MPKPENSYPTLFVVLLTITSIVSLMVATLVSPPSAFQLLPLIILVLLIALVEFFPLKLLNNTFSLNEILVFSGAVLYGIGITGWACVIAIGGVVGIKLINQRFRNQNQGAQDSVTTGGLISTNLAIIAMVIAFSITGNANGIGSNVETLDFDWGSILSAGLIFGIVHGVLYLFATYLKNKKIPRIPGWDLLALTSIEILPLFFGFMTLFLYPLLELGALIVLGAAVFALVLLLHFLSAPRRNLERRIQELSALDEISRTLSANIDLENLLESIQVQVTNLLNVDNFYVALLDPVDRQLWYPLAVKNGARQNWPRRPLTERLTDRVILDSKPILLPHHADQRIADIGLPSVEDAPYAWIGVPLIASGETIGCLALFSLSPEVEFSQDDLNLLNILSGQTSVAIEIALHNALLSSDVTIGRDRLTTVLNTVQDGLILLNPNGRITLANEAVQKLTGFPQSEFIESELQELPDSVIQSLGYSAQEIDELVVRIRENFDSAHDPEKYHLEVDSMDKVIERSIIPVSSHSSYPGGWIILLRDITEEFKLEQARELINETLVHDLRSPLSSTISALDVIQDSLANGDPAGIVEPSIQIAQRSSRRVLGMVESILEITRMESGKIELSYTDVSINSLIDQSIAEFKTVAMDYHVSILNDPVESLPSIPVDREKIHRVMNNLIDNALKHSPEEGKVTISARQNEGSEIEILVSDEGPGIPEEFRQRIFDRFVQVPGQKSRKRGSGLGLTYCRLAIEAHGGEIWVEENHGGGSRFIFSLPITKQETN